MAYDTFVKIEGIPGESLDSKYKDWIEVLNFDFGVKQPASATASSAGGATSGRAELSDLSITKFVDKASPKLFEACCKGQHISSLTLSVNRAGGDKVQYLEIKLEKVIVSSTNVTGTARPDSNGSNTAGEDLPVETVTFNFGSIKTTYTQQKRQDGSGGGNVTGGWDREGNKVKA